MNVSYRVSTTKNPDSVFITIQVKDSKGKWVNDPTRKPYPIYLSDLAAEHKRIVE